MNFFPLSDTNEWKILNLQIIFFYMNLEVLVLVIFASLDPFSEVNYGNNTIADTFISFRKGAYDVYSTFGE